MGFQKLGALWARKNNFVSGTLEIGDLKLPVHIEKIVKTSEKGPENALCIVGLYPVEGNEKGLVASGKLYTPASQPQQKILIFKNDKKGNANAPDFRITLATDEEPPDEPAKF